MRSLGRARGWIEAEGGAKLEIAKGVRSVIIVHVSDCTLLPSAEAPGAMVLSGCETAAGSLVVARMAPRLGGRWEGSQRRLGIQPPPICGGFSGLAACVVRAGRTRRRGEKAKLTPMFESTAGFQGRCGKETNGRGR